MGLRIQNNIMAMNAHRNLMTSNANMAKSLERLSSGFRINRAGDDAAGLAISQSFRAEIASYKVASRNASEANSLLQVAEGAMDQMGHILTRLKELATQAASDNAGLNRDKIDAEAQALLVEYERIATSTEYAGAKLLTGELGGGVSSPLTASVQSSIIDPTGSNTIVVQDHALRGEYTFSTADAVERGATVTFGSEIIEGITIGDNEAVGEWTLAAVAGSTNLFTLSDGTNEATTTLENVGVAQTLTFDVGGGTQTISLAADWGVDQANQVAFDVYAMTNINMTHEDIYVVESSNVSGLALGSGTTDNLWGTFELTAAAAGATTTFTLTNTVTAQVADVDVTTTALATATEIDLTGDFNLSLSAAEGTFSADTTATFEYGGTETIGAFDTATVGTPQSMDFEDRGIGLPLKEGWTTQMISDLRITVTGGEGVPGESMIFQIGSNNRTDHQLVVSLGDARMDAVELTGLSLLTREGAQEALGTVDTAIDNLANVRGDIGAYMNTLQYAMADIATTIENIQAAESVIRDADMAAEMTDFVKNQILVQAGTAMLAQANMAPQAVLGLIG